jgi:phosphate:Na+ symporter
MEWAPTAGSVAGGLGLFLIAIMLISNGLRMAAGNTLRSILSKWTRTRLRGLFSGALITAVVQSSSAVTAATIGFVNAGLLNLAQSLGVIYGSNIGTTMTGWIVAALGFRFKMEAFALPLIGIGAFMRILGNDRRMGAFGEALAGFGIFFVGIGILKTAFEGLAGNFDFVDMEFYGAMALPLFMGIGILLTILMQSSSAAIAITLTAAASDLLPVDQAAAVVIGANVGTTSTAILAAIGATANAKRTAAAHVIFNVVTAVVAMLILPGMLWATAYIRTLLGIAPFPATDLALFHTVFNILGAILMWPFTNRLALFLQKRFRTAEEDEAQPQYLDSTVAHTPVLALNALLMELKRMGGICARMGRSALSTELAGARSLAADRGAMSSLELAIGDFVANLDRAHLSTDVTEFLPQTIRVSQYYGNVAELAAAIVDANPQLEHLTYEELAEKIHQFKHDAVALFDFADPNEPAYNDEQAQVMISHLKDSYQSLKNALLHAGSSHRIAVLQMTLQMDQISRIRRMLEQVVKASHYIDSMNHELGLANPPTAGNSEAIPQEEAISDAS